MSSGTEPSATPAENDIHVRPEKTDAQTRHNQAAAPAETLCCGKGCVFDEQLVDDLWDRVAALERQLEEAQRKRIELEEERGYLPLAKDAIERAERAEEALRRVDTSESAPGHFEPAEWWKHVASKRRQIARDYFASVQPGDGPAEDTA